MKSQIRVPQTAVALALAFFANLSNVSAQKLPTVDPTQIIDKVKSIFAALQTDDIVMLNKVVAPDFYIYDGGARFNAKGILALAMTATCRSVASHMATILHD